MIWFFARGHERLQWELRRIDERFEIELRHPDGTQSVQSVDTPRELLAHVEATPRALMADGWHPVPRDILYGLGPIEQRDEAA